MAPKEDGKPALLGPSSPVHSGKIPTIRTLGFRKVSGVDSPPLLHAKMALLGNLWWHDKDESGHVVDVIGFEASRLWISSANFTYASRHHLEFGYWTEDPALIGGAKRFLVELMRSSEALDPESDFFDPELVSVEYDDEAMVQAMTEISQGDMAIEDWYYDG